MVSLEINLGLGSDQEYLAGGLHDQSIPLLIPNMGKTFQ